MVCFQEPCVLGLAFCSERVGVSKKGLVHMATEVDLNRWREAGKEIGRKIGVVEERNRIIELISDAQVAVCPCKPCDTKREIISLIKGENK